MTSTHPSRINPFPAGDSDRHAIWELAVERDIVAFLAQDWPLTGADFLDEGFVGHSGPANPDHWRISFPSLAAYRDAWIDQAEKFSKLEFAGVTKEDFLFETTVLRDIEITGDHALAHKKFDGRTKTVSGEDITLSWQSLYRLRRIDGQWKISGFVGYLPNPMPAMASHSASDGNTTSIELPPSAKRKGSAPLSPVLRVRAQEFAVISGQAPLNDAGEIVGTTIEEQTHLTLQNCISRLASGGATLADVFKVTVYLADMDEWERFNQVYRQYLREPYPVRTVIQAILWGGIRVEIEMMAVTR